MRMRERCKQKEEDFTSSGISFSLAFICTRNVCMGNRYPAGVWVTRDMPRCMVALIFIILLSRLYYILHLAFRSALIALYSQEGREETSDTPYVGLARRSVIGRRYFVDPFVE
jgi:hypothetical protein